jgi:hypothetical protein
MQSAKRIGHQGAGDGVPIPRMDLAEQIRGDRLRDIGKARQTASAKVAGDRFFKSLSGAYEHTAAVGNNNQRPKNERRVFCSPRRTYRT